MHVAHCDPCNTEGIRAPCPLWRSLDGMLGVFWEAEGAEAASGYYLAPDPRIMVFFNDVSDHIRISNGVAGDSRPMARAVYVPAGVPLWTSFSAAHRFSHLDLHLHSDRLLKILSPSLGGSEARTVMRRPVELSNAEAIETLSRLFVSELARPLRHSLHAESLVGSIATGLLDIPPDLGNAQAAGGLSPVAMQRLMRSANADGSRRLTVAEMAEIAGLSESWFARAFKQTTGKTPLQWQLGLRIEKAQEMLAQTAMPLADIAAQLGFADQAHLTKTFRQIAGQTPAAWCRMQQG